MLTLLIIILVLLLVSFALCRSAAISYEEAEELLKRYLEENQLRKKKENDNEA